MPKHKNRGFRSDDCYGASIGHAMAIGNESNRGEIVGVQYLRGIAALLVVVFHASLQMKRLSGSSTLDTFASRVDVFFIISGFVMVVSTDAGRRSTPLDFLQKRIIRIGPLYWTATAAMILVLLVTPQFVQSSKLSWSHALASFAFIARENPATVGLYDPLVAPGWTLNLEILFYIFFALGLQYGRHGWKLVAVTSAPVVALTIWGLVENLSGAAAFYTNPVIMEFVYGIILGLIFVDKKLRLAPTLAAAVALLGLSLLLFPLSLPPMSRPIRFGLPALMVVGGSIWLKVPNSRLLHELGDASYSIYITHFFLLSALAQVWKQLHLLSLLGSTLFLPAASISCLLSGSICWRYIERPITRQFRGFIGRKEKALTTDT